MQFLLSGLDAQMEPSITKWGFEDLDDAPSMHRWRAFWEKGAGISLTPYPVVKVTPCGVKIDTMAFRKRGADGKYWRLSDNPYFHRMLMEKSGQAWAKPTQEEAIKSLAIRLTRWTSRLVGDFERASERAEFLAKLRPDLATYADTARKNLASVK
jgi:hypothetical protein